MKCLVTGTGSGIGRFLYRHLSPTDTIVRTTNHEEISRIYQSRYDVILHCAFNSIQPEKISNVNGSVYLNDNIFFTRRLLSIPHRLFIFFSTDRVYPNTLGPHLEDDILYFRNMSDIYSYSKLISEISVMEQASSYLILRCVSLLGLDSRKSTSIQLLENRSCKLSLEKKSRYNFVLHQDVAKFIDLTITDGVRGIFNVSSTKDICLEEMINLLPHRPKVQFGSHYYSPRQLGTQKIGEVTDIFQKTSEQVWGDFISLARQEN